MKTKANQSIASQLEMKGQPYNAAGLFVGNNCITYAYALADTIKEDDKEKCEWLQWSLAVIWY